MNRLSRYLERLVGATTTLDDILGDVGKVMSGEQLLTKQQADKIAATSPYLDADLMVQLNKDDNQGWAKANKKPGKVVPTTAKSPMAGSAIPPRSICNF